MKTALKDLGLEDSMISKIYKLHQDELNGNFIPKHRFDEVNEESKLLKTSLSERDTQLASLKVFEGQSVELKAKIQELETSNAAATLKFTDDLKTTQMQTAIKLSLAGKVHDASLVAGLLDTKLIQMDDKGEIKSGFAEQFENLRKEKAFLFTTDAKPPAPTGFKPAGNEPPEGKPGHEVDESVAFGKQTAAGRIGSSEVAAKADKHYFGGGI
jgi:Tfp pilus assembly major pilin PilA